MDKNTDKNIENYLRREMSGAKFKKRFPNLSKNLVKLTNETEIQNEFQYKTGLNVDNNVFDPLRHGWYLNSGHGMYITDIDNTPILLGDRDRNFKIKYYRYVTLPDDCRIYGEGPKFKVNKIILSERINISELPYLMWSDLNRCLCLRAVKKNSDIMMYIRNISEMNETDKIAIVQQDGLAIEYLLNYGVSEEVQKAAVEENGGALWYLLNKGISVSEEVQIAAVRQNSDVIKYLLEKDIPVSEEVQIAAIKQNSYAIKKPFALFPVSEEAHMAFIKQNSDVIKYLSEKDIPLSEKVQKAAISFFKMKMLYLDVDAVNKCFSSK